VFDSVTISALSSALDGLAQRQRAIADNIANVNTPNYHAKRVQFEEALADAVASGTGRATATVSEATTSISTPRRSPASTRCCATSSRRRPSTDPSRRCDRR
jgi:flagellar basal-body rod protein FlgB